MGPNYTATLVAYSACTAGASALSAAKPVPASSTVQLAVPLMASLSKGDPLCVMEHYIYAGAGPAPVPPLADSVSNAEITIDRTPGSPFSPSGQTKLDLSRVSGGFEVSSSASVDPAARFLLDAAFDFPFSNRDNSLYNTWWGSGYVRLSSIAQPGAVSGIADVGTYIKPLTDSTPNHLADRRERVLIVQAGHCRELSPTIESPLGQVSWGVLLAVQSAQHATFDV